MAGEVDDVRAEQLRQLTPPRVAEGGRDPDVPQFSAVVVEAEQQRADLRPVGEQPAPATTQSAVCSRLTLTIARTPGW
jgi:hypothetical protein